MVNSVPPKRCVIADDLRASRELVRAWLRESGFQCEVVDQGDLAWQLIRNQPPDLLITDIEMPVCCGLELLLRVRQSPFGKIKNLPVLTMTSLCDSQTRNVILSMGGDGLLIKPLEKKSTLATILDLIANRETVDRFFKDNCNQNDASSGVISPTLRRLVRTVALNEKLKSL